jgi:hypothetical protein
MGDDGHSRRALVFANIIEQVENTGPRRQGGRSANCCAFGSLGAGYEEAELPAALRPEFTADLATLAAADATRSSRPGGRNNPPTGK